MKTITQGFYGDSVRWFMGVVEEVGQDDPPLGRVRVRIYGIHGTRDEVPIADLPYAQTLVPTTEPGVSGLGRNPYLQQGATVFGMFLDGKGSQLPLVMGSIPVVELPTPEQMSAAPLDATERGTRDTSLSVRNPRAALDRAPSGGGSFTPPPPSGSTAENTEYCWNYLKNLNCYSNAAIAALLGNFMAESNMQPSAQGDVGLRRASDVSIGIAQWYNGTSRQANLISHARSMGKSEYDLEAQISFVHHELRTSFANVRRAIENETNVDRATLVVHRQYEIPAYVEPVAYSPIDGQRMRLHEDRRLGYARQIYNTYTRTTTA